MQLRHWAVRLLCLKRCGVFIMNPKAVWRVAIILFIPIGVALLYLHRKRTEPVRVIKAFVHAVERQDVNTIYQLTIPQEREKLGVTKEAIRSVLATTLWRRSPVVGNIRSVEIRGYYAIASGEWLDAETKQPLLANYGPAYNPGVMVLVISALGLTPEGWRVSTARFLVGRDFQTFGNLNLCRKARLKGVVDVKTGHVISLSEMERQLALLSQRYK
jgi:hypothetical protein